MDKLVTENDKCNKTQLERRESKGREKRELSINKIMQATNKSKINK
jgi:hypothetical protein